MIASLALLQLVQPTASHGAERGANGSWALWPKSGESHFVYEAAPGDMIRDTAVLSNLTDDPIPFQVYAADGYNTVADGAFALEQETDSPDDIGLWAEPSLTHLTVTGKHQVEIPFTIEVPENATPGDHIGGLVALDPRVQAPEAGGDLELGVRRAVGVRVYLTVAGERQPAVEIEDLSARAEPRGIGDRALGSGPVSIDYVVHNTGNTRLLLTAEVDLRNLIGNRVATLSRDLPELLPGQRLAVRQLSPDLPPAGRLSIEVVVLATDLRATASTTLWRLPLALVAVLLLLLGVVTRTMARRRAASTARTNERTSS